MNFATHVILLIGNLIISTFASMMTLSSYPELGNFASLIVGGCVFLLGGQIHLIYVLRQTKEDLQARLLALHQDNQVYLDRIEELSHEADSLKEHVNTLDKGDNKEIVNEMRLLQTLLNQVVEKSGKSFSKALKTPKTDDYAQGIEREADEILNVMHYALEDNRIDLYLQPIVSLPSRKTVHYEAYSRVRDDKGEVIFPSQYIKLAEDSGLVSTLDNLLLFRCIQVIRRLGARRPNMRFFCNISSVSLNDKDFFPQFVDFMLDNQELADRLVFEFTQQDVMRQSNDVWQSLGSLGRKGFSFSMDNVDVLNHDIANLAGRYFRYVKIKPDLFLDDKLDIDRRDLKEAYARYEIELIIEKIEQDDMLVEILECGIERGQGYLFGEPVLSSDITSKL
ncbi:EAL domain-containing protein [Pseudemcibacter aquimaris]|uniref:EAL domain-containing protein n=1 Tax=Pseudemcibacter aquimaris TaxID=2857064 RepID=UPI0020133ABF|nr:EAL domain-containing protein [Pseudemcibacter aquimaris]MCC3862287.1 EAL domain-containing protein [Pseudemcibacter aquimaris]WDU59037.1 EAL domain-containing protein [Pseudemcibacter aquimaris]